GGATLLQLSRADKAKVARLMQELLLARQEVQAATGRVDRLRAQNQHIVHEMSELRAKFNQSLQLLRKYQERV
ncbi:unnamed protein product, partial [Phaeothamnion confervicola]